MKTPTKLIAGALLLAGLLLGAYWLGIHADKQITESIEPAPAQSLPSGAVVLERAPAVAAIKPKKAGVKVERAASVTVQPDQADCAPVTVDMQLVQDGDGRRIIASSPDGTVIAGVDVPVAALKITTRRVWAAGMSCDPSRCKETVSVWLDRDVGQIRVGLEVQRDTTGKPAVRAKAGWVW